MQFSLFCQKKKLEMLIETEQNYINLSRIKFTHQTHNSTKTSFNKIAYECAQLINQDNSCIDNGRRTK
jgi:uncharacterized protein (UPF0210 family)